VLKMINKYVCLGCGNVAEFEEGDGKGYVTSWKCKCGHLNNIADMNNSICSVKIINVED